MSARVPYLERVENDGQSSPFHERVRKLQDAQKGRRGQGKKRKKVLYERQANGLLVPVAVAPSTAPTFPWKSVVLALVLMIALKGFLYAQFGAEALSQRIAELGLKSELETAIAWVLAPEPVSGWAADQIKPFLPNPYTTADAE